MILLLSCIDICVCTVLLTLKHHVLCKSNGLAKYMKIITFIHKRGEKSEIQKGRKDITLTKYCSSAWFSQDLLCFNQN